jgi:hypothetical protein
MDGNNLFKAALKFGGMAFNAYNDYSNQQPNTNSSSNNNNNSNNQSSANATRLQSQIKFCSYPERYL